MAGVSVEDATTHPSRLLSRLASGEKIVIDCEGTPVACLASVATSGQNRRPGAWRGKVSVADDFDCFNATAESD